MTVLTMKAKHVLGYGNCDSTDIIAGLSWHYRGSLTAYEGSEQWEFINVTCAVNVEDEVGESSYQVSGNIVVSEKIYIIEWGGENIFR